MFPLRTAPSPLELAIGESGRRGFAMWPAAFLLAKRMTGSRSPSAICWQRGRLRGRPTMAVDCRSLAGISGHGGGSQRGPHHRLNWCRYRQPCRYCYENRAFAELVERCRGRNLHFQQRRWDQAISPPPTFCSFLSVKHPTKTRGHRRLGRPHDLWRWVQAKASAAKWLAPSPGTQRLRWRRAPLARCGTACETAQGPSGGALSF